MNQPTAPEVIRKPQGESLLTPPAAAGMPNPGRLFQTFNAYQQTAAMNAAIELDIFTAIADRPKIVSFPYWRRARDDVLLDWFAFPCYS